MFAKSKKIKRIDAIFHTLLLKYNRNAMSIRKMDILELYKRAIEIAETLDSLEYIYQINGEINKNLLNIEEFDDF